MGRWIKIDFGSLFHGDFDVMKRTLMHQCRLARDALITSLMLLTPRGTRPITRRQPVARGGGQVIAGQAAIAQSIGKMDITQSTNRATIDWQSFNVGRIWE